MKEMLAEEEKHPGAIFDHAFIRDYTAGYDEFIADLRATSWDDILVSSGLTREQIRAAADIAMKAKRIICCWAMGLTQHKNAVATIQEIMNFLLLGGNIGRPGAGPCPVRGHSNVQGDRTMGIWERMSDAFIEKLGAEFGFEPPREHGPDTVGNDQTDARRENSRLRRDGRQFSLRDAGHGIHREGVAELSADRACLDQAQSLASHHRRHRAHSAVPWSLGNRSAGDGRAIRHGRGFDGNHQFVARCARTGERSTCGASRRSSPDSRAPRSAIARALIGKGLAADYGRIRDHIENVIPGFERFNERIAQNVFYLPNAARDQRRFDTESGKAKFTVHPIPRNELPPGRYIMMTIRSHDQFNTHIYGLDDRYRGIYNGRRVVFMNKDDMAEIGVQQGQFVDLTSHFDDGERSARHFPSRALQHSAWLHRHLFSGSERARADQQRGRSLRTRRRASLSSSPSLLRLMWKRQSKKSAAPLVSQLFFPVAPAASESAS